MIPTTNPKPTFHHVILCQQGLIICCCSADDDADYEDNKKGIMTMRTTEMKLSELVQDTLNECECTNEDVSELMVELELSMRMCEGFFANGGGKS